MTEFSQKIEALRSELNNINVLYKQDVVGFLIEKGLDSQDAAHFFESQLEAGNQYSDDVNALRDHMTSNILNRVMYK